METIGPRGSELLILFEVELNSVRMVQMYSARSRDSKA